MAIRALILDLGRVLVAEGEPVGRQRWERRLGLADGDLQRIVSAAVGPGWVGARTEAEIRARVQHATGLVPDEVAQLLEDFHSHAYLDPALASVVADARSRYKVAALSNAGPDQREAMVRKFNLENLVDVMVISAEEGVQKPDATIYLRTANRLGVSPAQCLFVDDQERNVEGARAVGMLAVLHVSLSRRPSQPSTDTSPWLIGRSRDRTNRRDTRRPVHPFEPRNQGRTGRSRSPREAGRQ